MVMDGSTPLAINSYTRDWLMLRRAAAPAGLRSQDGSGEAACARPLPDSGAVSHAASTASRERAARGKHSLEPTSSRVGIWCCFMRTKNSGNRCRQFRCPRPSDIRILAVDPGMVHLPARLLANLGPLLMATRGRPAGQSNGNGAFSGRHLKRNRRLYDSRFDSQNDSQTDG